MTQPIGSRRSPYGIREPAVKPPVFPSRPNWLHSLLKYREVLIPNAAVDRMRTWLPKTTATTSPRFPSDYDTKVRGFQSSGLSSMEPYPLVEPSTVMRPPWPIGTVTGQPSDKRGRDYQPRSFPGMRGPVYGAETAKYGALHSAQDRRRRDLVPISGARPSFGLDYGAAPWRVPFIRKSGLQLMAGVCQFSTQQFYSGVAGVSGPSGSILMAPPTWSDYTRGLRGVSGITQRVQGPGRSRVPAVFVPREVR